MEEKKIKSSGLKVTTPRIKVLQILTDSSIKHLSAEEIYNKIKQEGDDISLATIYRVLTQFEQAQLINRHNFEGGYAVYEINSGHHHDHLVCIECNGVYEFNDEVIEDRQQQVADKYKFKMTHHHLNIYGICDKCNS